MLGAAWYVLSVDRYLSCWKSICKREDSPTKCLLEYLSCDASESIQRNIWIKNTTVFQSCDPNNGDISFKFGIFQNAVTKQVVSSSFMRKYLYCLWWGLQNLRYAHFLIFTTILIKEKEILTLLSGFWLSSYGQNLSTSTFIGETSFAITIAIVGLVLFAHLIGNMQVPLNFIPSVMSYINGDLIV